MVIIQQVVQSQTSGARTSDWIGQVKGHIIYAYDISTLVSEEKRTLPASESWIFNNPEALGAVRRGLNDAALGRVSKVNLDNL